MKPFFIGLLSICFYTNTAQIIKTAADNSVVIYHGRTIKNNENVKLISSASYAEFQFAGDSCIVGLTNVASSGDYNYVAIELDNKYKGRIKVANTNAYDYVITATQKKAWHLLRIYKATEAQNGLVSVNYIKALKLKRVNGSSKKKIEFIGNSITCGFGDDDKEIPCNNGSKWYDQHNAYWSYAPRIARSLNADFMLSAISGAGIYRNWNSDGPTVPQQYESVYLVIDSAARWNFKNYIPDIVVIALGTNDLSGGDGKIPRKPFDSAIFVDTYVKFLKIIYGHYANTQIVLITSPMLNGKNAEKLLLCLKAVRALITQQSISARAIKIFEFKSMHATGCDEHPTIKEHEEMANELLPFMKEVMKELK
ncbi:MAG TPA: GDSL-type esterase/lipase family protein [Puia sp.]|jgi:lysophospholipase L1-like esterase|nr:GDSL-type esterase/lipase family protein [Puia sp.]